MKMIALGSSQLSNKAPGNRMISLFFKLPLVIFQMIGSSRAGLRPVT
jgi:hypothetical protein